MSYKIKIEDPSGQTRTFQIQGDTWIGRDESMDVTLKDPIAPLKAALLKINPYATSSSPYWIFAQQSSQDPSEKLFPIQLGDIHVTQSELPIGLPFKIGETTLTLLLETQTQSLPAFPTNITPWLTDTDEGKEILWTLKKASPTSLSLYLAGETGTGKEVLAHLIHAWSEQASGPFVPLHCSALPLSLVESELFGHVKGAFTGALRQRPGALLQAHGGTLFLDEVGDLPQEIQVKLLRFLENGEIRPVGGDHCVHASVRLVCATHKPLDQLVQEGKFRQDLYYRLASITIQIPPLRSRPRDIELLAKKFAQSMGKILSKKALHRLQAHSWPGNVRELRHSIERACGLSSPFESLLTDQSFDFLMKSENIKLSPELGFGAPILTIKEMERLLLMKALKITNGNRNEAATILGVARSTVFEMLKRHKIQGPRQRVA